MRRAAADSSCPARGSHAAAAACPVPASAAVGEPPSAPRVTAYDELKRAWRAARCAPPAPCGEPSTGDSGAEEAAAAGRWSASISSAVKSSHSSERLK